MTCYCNQSLAGASGRQTVFGSSFSRPVTIQYPNAFQGNRTYPLLLTLHGYGQTGAGGRGTLCANSAKDWGSGMIVASPEGKADSLGNQFWNATAAFLDKDGTAPNDQAYLRALILEIMGAWPIDPRYVIVMGYSTGGSMAHMLGRASSDIVTHVISCSGVGPLAGDPRTVTPTRPVNVIHFHGTSDVTVTYAGSPPGVAGAGIANYPGAVTTCNDWATLNGCTGSLATYDSVDLVSTVAGNETDRQTYTTNPANGAVEHWKANGDDHTINLIELNWVKRVYDWVMARPRT